MTEKCAFLAPTSPFMYTGAQTERQAQYTYLESCLRLARELNITQTEDKVDGVVGRFTKVFSGKLDKLLIQNSRTVFSVQEAYTGVTWLLLREL